MNVTAMLDIAYLSLMLACLVGCAGLVGWLARSEEPALPSPKETDR